MFCDVLTCQAGVDFNAATSFLFVCVSLCLSICQPVCVSGCILFVCLFVQNRT